MSKSNTDVVAPLVRQVGAHIAIQAGGHLVTYLLFKDKDLYKENKGPVHLAIFFTFGFICLAVCQK